VRTWKQIIKEKAEPAMALPLTEGDAKGLG